jgi:DNA-binding transcriptional ArsR family regulator
MTRAARVFKALADPTRRQILQELKGGELMAGAIADHFAVSAPTISRHLSVLEAAGLVTPRRQGNRIFYRLEAEPLAECLGDFLSAVCPAQKRLRRREESSS